MVRETKNLNKIDIFCIQNEYRNLKTAETTIIIGTKIESRKLEEINLLGVYIYIYI
jgi:hypothetical protein